MRHQRANPQPLEVSVEIGAHRAYAGWFTKLVKSGAGNENASTIFIQTAQVAGPPALARGDRCDMANGADGNPRSHRGPGPPLARTARSLMGRAVSSRTGTDCPSPCRPDRCGSGRS